MRIFSTQGVTPHSAILPAARQTWRQLLFFNFYRLVLSCLLAALALGEGLPEPMGSYYPRLFLLVALAYVVVSLFWYPLIIWRFPSFTTQTAAQVFLDILLITLLMHASGGIGSGLGMLLIVVIAGGGLLIPGRVAMLFAAMASIALLAEQIRWSIWLPQYIEPVANYTQAGMLGITFFATAALAMELGNRVRRSAAVAVQKTRELEDLAMLNDEIVKRLQAGLLVVGADNCVILANQAAEALLGNPIRKGQTLDQVRAPLRVALQQWRDSGRPGATLEGDEDGRRALLARFTGLGRTQQAHTLILLEDAAVLKQHAQLLNMASLGKLSASIAHEVRNPLAAISNAAQLLEEEETTSEESRRLTSIILRHSDRVNHLVNEILALGKQREFHPRSFSLGPWLHQFVSDFVTTREIRPDQVRCLVSGDFQLLFDQDQLHQVLWNLCDNALMHGHEPGEDAVIDIHGGFDEGSARQVIEVADRGPGIRPAHVAEVFEPFFTTTTSGSGLGLYVCRELCESNRGSLEYLPREGGGSLFRILLPRAAMEQVA